MRIDNISNKIADIIYKADKANIFEQRFHIIASNLDQNLQKIIDFQQSNNSEIKQEKLLELDKELDLLSEKIDQTQDKSIFWNYLLDTQPIQQIINDLDKHMKNIISKIKSIGVKYPVNYYSTGNFEDYAKIADFLMNAQQIIKNRRKEVDEYLKQNHEDLTDCEKNIDEENIFELSKYREYQLNKSDIDESPQINYKNDVFDYYNGIYHNKKLSITQKVTILKLKPAYKIIFKRLLSVLVKIDHPYVENFVGSYIEDGEVTIVTNRSGVNLSKYLLNDKGGNRTIMAFKIAQGMLYLHSRNILHRNLTEESIFIPENENKEANPLICGFRDSRFLPVNPTSAVTSKDSKKEKSLQKFIAPEYYTETRYDEKVDVFAFSGILYKLITNQVPFYDLPKNADIEKLLENDRPTLPDDLPENLQNLINSCWEQDPNKRFSFDKIVATMIREKIVFPCDESNRESIEKFYENNSIKNSSAITCIDSFEKIKKEIGYAFQYRFEFLRIRPIIHNYQYLFRQSKYAKKDEFDDDESENLEELKEDLHDLSLTVTNCQYDIWTKNGNKAKVNLVTEDINSQMEKIYESMINLGFSDIPKYEESINDLVFDYRELINYFNNRKEWRNKVVEVKNFMKDQKNWNEACTFKVLNERIHDLFTPFRRYKTDRSCYEIERNNRPIAKTNISEVYKGHPVKNLNEKVAIKILRGDHFRSENELTFLRREIGFLTKLHHDNIAEFIGFALSENDNDVWLISEWVPDGTLLNRLRMNELSPNDKAKIAFEIAEAMRYIHSKNVLHLDLKSGNILLDGNKPKIIDFGFSCPDNDALKIKNEKIGTINYMAPEVYRGEGYNKFSDIFSFSMLLWEMVTNEIPFSTDEESKIPDYICKGVRLKYKFEERIESGNPLLLFIRRGTSPTPSKRFYSFDSICSVMAREHLTFPGGNSDELIEFYNGKFEKLYSKKKPKIK
ncbi:hypothetical protein M9Y10_015126 [Tritrichomonas musculus]|uniref:Protein kinase domain-containing protein n=1 Tax=Tritrichomonas musculus TaxID=1915356 RepID=A0ABR2L1F3_9EUKA